MKHINVFSYIAFVVLLFSLLSAVRAGDDPVDHEIFLVFERDCVTFPTGVDTASIDSVVFSDTLLAPLLGRYNTEWMLRCVPEYNFADSMWVNSWDNELTVRKPEQNRYFVIRIQDAQDQDELADSLRLFDEIISSDRIATGEDLQVDDYWSYQWSINDELQDTLRDIGAGQAWNLETGDADSYIAICEKFPILSTHQDLEDEFGNNRIYGSYNTAINEYQELLTNAKNRHATQVAGIIAAKHEDNEGIKGILGYCNLFGAVLGEGTSYNFSRTLSECNSFLDDGNKLCITNYSWGLQDLPTLPSGFHSYTLPYMTASAVRSHNLGLLLVAGRGNSGDTTFHYPACMIGDFVFAVGAHNCYGQKSEYSSSGTGHVDLWAPSSVERLPEEDGTDIATTSFYEIFHPVETHSHYSWFTGTSAATPHVSGVAGLIFDYYHSLYPNDFLWPDDIHKILEIGGTTQGLYSGIDYCPRLRADSSLYAISSPNEVFAHLSVTGGSYVSTDSVEMRFYNKQPLNFVEYYDAVRYEVTRRVDYDDLPEFSGNPWDITPQVWGVGHKTEGLYWGEDEDDISYGLRWCEVTTSDINGFRLKSYVYYIEDLPQGYRWYPEHYNSMELFFTVVGDRPPQVPIDLSAQAAADFHVQINWDANTEDDLDGYRLFRWISGIQGGYQLIATVDKDSTHYIDDDYWVDILHLEDPEVDVSYKLTAFDIAGNESMPTAPIVVPACSKPPFKRIADGSIPEITSLGNFYPNPFNTTTAITFGLHEQGDVSVVMYNILGRQMKHLTWQAVPPGSYHTTIDMTSLASGVYFVNVKLGKKQFSRKIISLK